MQDNIDTGIKDIFSAIDRSSMHMPVEISVPNNFYQQLLDFFLERGYLNTIQERERFVDFRAMGGTERKDITWLKVTRLPIHPNELKEYDLLSRWQSVLSTLHTWGHRLVFLLQRRNGETHIYLGTTALSRNANAKQALEQFKEAAMSGMPGIELYPLLSKSEQLEFADSLADNSAIGAVTGIPSLRRNSQFGILQTLDQLAFGIRDINGIDRDFSLMVVADPVEDQEISRTISNFRRLGSEIHLDVMRSVTETETLNESKTSNVGIGAIISSLGTILHIPVLSMMNGMFNKSVTKAAGSSKSVVTQYLDKFAQYAEEVTDKHCTRLSKGRNLGFWNAGIYVLGKSNKDITTVMGMLRAIYSGDESFVEPIRVHLLNDKSGALDIVRRCDLIPLVSDKLPPEDQKRDWNILGRIYQYVIRRLTPRSCPLPPLFHGAMFRACVLSRPRCVLPTTPPGWTGIPSVLAEWWTRAWFRTTNTGSILTPL